MHRPKTSRERLVEDAEALEQLAPYAEFFRAFGASGDRLADLLLEAKGSGAKARELATLHERFNGHFLDRGWVAYELMKNGVIEECVSLAEGGDIDAAERILVDMLDEKTMGYQLMWIDHVRAAKPRRRLLRLAAADYQAGRYHACVPVVLAQIDGLFADLTGHSLFVDAKVKAPKIVAWDSISAIEGGLPALLLRFATPRGKTRTDDIDDPFRHGVLHGRDLGYANKKVATKAWAALFAMRDWALKVESGQLEPPSPSE